MAEKSEFRFAGGSKNCMWGAVLGERHEALACLLLLNPMNCWFYRLCRQLLRCNITKKFFLSFFNPFWSPLTSFDSPEAWLWAEAVESSRSKSQQTLAMRNVKKKEKMICRKMLKLLNFISCSSRRSLSVEQTKNFFCAIIDQSNALAEYFYTIHRMRESSANHSCGISSSSVSRFAAAISKLLKALSLCSLHKCTFI